MIRSVVLLPMLVVLLAGMVLAAWWWPNRLQGGDVVMPAGRLNSVSFAPFRDGQSPLTDQFPSAAEVDQDLALLAPHVRAIRSYASLGGDYDLAAMAKAHGLKLWLGVWLGGDRAQNAREVAAAIAIANRHPATVERVVVGNEVLLRRDLPPGELIAAIDRVRAAVRQPVTYADVWEFWQQFPEVAAHVDIVTIHLLPVLGGRADRDRPRGGACRRGVSPHGGAVSGQADRHRRDRLAEPRALAAGRGAGAGGGGAVPAPVRRPRGARGV